MARIPIIADRFVAVGDPNIFVEREQLQSTFRRTDTVLRVLFNGRNFENVFSFGDFLLHPFHCGSGLFADFFRVHELIQPNLFLRLEIIARELSAVDEYNLIVGTERAGAGHRGRIFKANRKRRARSRAKPRQPNPRAKKGDDYDCHERNDQPRLFSLLALCDVALTCVSGNLDVVGLGFLATKR